MTAATFRNALLYSGASIENRRKTITEQVIAQNGWTKVLAASLLVIGIAPARASILTGNLAVYNAAGTTLLGYVSKTYDGQNTFTYSNNSANALTVQVASSPAQPFAIVEPTPPLTSTSNYFAAVGGSGGYNITPTVAGYAYLSSGTLTASGSTPSSVPPSADDIDLLGYNGPEETTLWSHTGQILTPGWVNTDNTTYTDVVYYDPVVDFLGITADLSAYNANFGDGAYAVTLEFSTPFPSSAAPEPGTSALGGIALAGAASAMILK